MGVLRFFHLVTRHGLKAIGKQQALVDVLVVDHQQAMLGAAIQGEVHQAVVVHAHLHRLVFGAVAGIRFVRRHLPRNTHRLAPRRQNLVHIVSWQFDEVPHANGHGFEANLAGRLGQQGRRRTGQQAQPGREFQRLTLGGVGQLVNMGVGGGVAVLHL